MPALVGTVVQFLMLLHAWSSPAARSSQAAGLRYRFHHVHVSVADPAGAMNAAAARVGGTRTLLQGHGVAVRSAGQYLVFDRETSESARGAGAPKPDAGEAVYSEAVRWLNERRGTTEPSTLEKTAVAVGVSDDRVSAIAFSTEDLNGAVDALAAGADQPFARTADNARFRLPSSAVIEIVRETDLPDAFWCPMHPDIRAALPDKCPVCGMTLVPIPPPVLGEYRLDAMLTRGRGAGGPALLKLVVRDPQTHETVQRFVDVHERFLHLFVISRDLSNFAHLHPEQREDGTFEVVWALPTGEYVLVVDFLPAAGTPQMVHRVIATPGYNGSLFAAAPELRLGETEQVVDGLRIRLETGKVVAFRSSDLRFTISDARTGAPVSDLEPLLGASGHLLLVNADVTTAIHGHPEGSPSPGPIVTFAPLIPAPGLYKLWVQVQRAGKVITAPFVIEATPPSP
jgi:Heavy metal binding domain